MAGISGDYYSMSSYANSRTAFTGLASGLDTDSIIETMMQGYQGQLDKLYQKRDKTEWKIEAYRGVSDALIEFQNKYLGSKGSSSIFSSDFFKSSTITSNGNNASAVSVTGGANEVKNLQIKEITQLSKTATLTGEFASEHAIYSDVALSDSIKNGKYYSALEGQTLNLSVNGSTYNLTLSNIEVVSNRSGSNYYQDAEKIVEALNKSLQDAGIGDKVQAQLSNGRVSLVAQDASAGSVKISGGGKKMLDTLGFSTGQTTSYGGVGITGAKAISNEKTYEVSNLDSLEGKSITFDLDGVTKKITFDDTMKNADNYKDASGKVIKFSDIKDEEDFVTYFNGKLKDAFGGKIEAELEDGKLKLSTPDDTATLSVSDGDVGVIGASGFLGIEKGAANRLFRFEDIADSNLNLSDSARNMLRDGGKQDVTINGTTFSVYSDRIEIFGADGKRKATHNFEEGTTINDLQNVINNADIGATMKYNSTSDKFTLMATESGSLGEVNVSFNLESDGLNQLTEALFGKTEKTWEDGKIAKIEFVNPNYTEGKDAQAVISMDGGNTWETVSRSSNTFKMNGISITLNSVFSAAEKDENGVATGNVNEEDIVTFSGKANTDEMIEKIKEFVDAYNELATKINSELSAKADSDYQPLTSAEREELSEDQIELYEEKAKTGLLSGDSLLRSLSTDFRFAMSMPMNGDVLSSIGISTVSFLTNTTGSKHGLLEIDEDKLREAIETDPDRVEKLFAGTGSGAADDGILNRLNSTLDKYVNTSTLPEKRGLLISKAGNKASSISLTSNSMYKELTNIKDQIDRYIQKMQAKQEAYYSQFTTLETFINQMNQQSSWLASNMGMSY